MDRSINAPLPKPKSVELEDISLRLDHLLTEAAQANPELQHIRERIEAYRQRLELAKLQRRPDLTVSVSYNAVDSNGLAPGATGKDQWWVGLGVNRSLIHI